MRIYCLPIPKLESEMVDSSLKMEDETEESSSLSLLSHRSLSLGKNEEILNFPLRFSIYKLGQ